MNDRFSCRAVASDFPLTRHFSCRERSQHKVGTKRMGLSPPLDRLQHVREADRRAPAGMPQKGGPNPAIAHEGNRCYAASSDRIFASDARSARPQTHSRRTNLTCAVAAIADVEAFCKFRETVGLIRLFAQANIQKTCEMISRTRPSIEAVSTATRVVFGCAFVIGMNRRMSAPICAASTRNLGPVCAPAEHQVPELQCFRSAGTTPRDATLFRRRFWATSLCLHRS